MMRIEVRFQAPEPPPPPMQFQHPDPATRRERVSARRRSASPSASGCGAAGVRRLRVAERDPTNPRPGDGSAATSPAPADRARSSSIATVSSPERVGFSGATTRAEALAGSPRPSATSISKRLRAKRGCRSARRRPHADRPDRRARAPLGAAAAATGRSSPRDARPASRCRKIVGRREFWGLSLVVSPDVLDPRPETETIVEAALALSPRGAREPLRILDLGVGSGALLCALLSEFPAARGLGVDRPGGGGAVARAQSRGLRPRRGAPSSRRRLGRRRRRPVRPDRLQSAVHPERRNRRSGARGARLRSAARARRRRRRARRLPRDHCRPRPVCSRRPAASSSRSAPARPTR